MDLHTNTIQTVDHNFRVLCNWYQNSETNSCTVYGKPGNGKCYLLTKFISFIVENYEETRVLWIEFRTLQELIEHFEEVNNCACAIDSFSEADLKHQLTLFSTTIYWSPAPWLVIVANLSSTLSEMFENILFESKVANLKLVYICSQNTMDEAVLASNKEESVKEFICSINKHISSESIDQLCRLTDFNMLLLKLSACLVTCESPLYGNEATWLIRKLNLIQERLSLFEKFATFPDSKMFVFIKYFYEHVSKKHILGVFASEVLSLTVHLKSWLPISVMENLKFPFATYNGSKIEEGKAVGAISLSVLRKFGFLHFTENQQWFRVPRVLRNFIEAYKPVKNATEMILLNMRYTDGFINLVACPLKAIYCGLSKENIKTLRQHAMAILRNPFHRMTISEFKGVSVEKMLHKVLNNMGVDELEGVGEKFEIKVFIAENEYFKGNTTEAIESYKKLYGQAGKVLHEDDISFLRITQAFCFLCGLDEQLVEQSQTLFAQLQKYADSGVVDVEALSAIKMFYKYSKSKHTHTDMQTMTWCYQDIFRPKLPPSLSLTQSKKCPRICTSRVEGDKKLQIIPHGWDSINDKDEFKLPHFSVLPSLTTFVQLADIAYFDHEEDGTCNHTSKRVHVVDGFTFLSAGKVSNTSNGYYGVAYVNKYKRQIIISHRGTVAWTFEDLSTDKHGIVLKRFVPHVPYAMTYAHKVAEYAAKHDYELFFTGHSIGGWLAQITTFSTIYLTLDDEVTGRFVCKQPLNIGACFPYTVVFDCPGSYEFILWLKTTHFPQQLESIQDIDVKNLPVEVFLFNPSLVNFQVGRVLIFDMEKARVDTMKHIGTRTHQMEPVGKLLGKLGKKQANNFKMIDYSITKNPTGKNSWDGKIKTVEWDRLSVPLYFFSREEQNFLEEAKRSFPSEGKFEGVYWVDEKIANDLVGMKVGKFLWKLTGSEYSMVSCGEDRSQFIPRIRHTFKSLRKRGTLWWNPRKFQLPTNFVDRRMCPTANIKEVKTARQVGRSEKHSVKPFSAMEVLSLGEKLVLLVDPPGLGVPTAITKLEMELRSEMNYLPRIIVRLNLKQEQENILAFAKNVRTQSILTNYLSFLRQTLTMFENLYLGNEPQLHVHQASHASTSRVKRFLELFVKYIPIKLLEQSIRPKTYRLPVFFLLDGPEEVCPIYQNPTLDLLQSLISVTPQDLFIVSKVIITTRPHLQKLIEYHFNVKANSLLPLDLMEQTEYLRNEVGHGYALTNTPKPSQSLLSRPLMLALYAQVVKSRGSDKKHISLYEVYSHYIAATHELNVLKKEEANSSKPIASSVASMLGDNLKYYYACAVAELIGRVETKKSLFRVLFVKSYGISEELLQQPTGSKLENLISFGLLEGGEGRKGRFIHGSFAEFFYAIFLTDESKAPRKLRDVLFGRIYETDKAENVGKFVRAILQNKQQERSGKKFAKSSSGSVPVLVEDEAVLFLGNDRMRSLVKGWLDLVKDRSSAKEALIHNMRVLQPDVRRLKPVEINFKQQRVHLIHGKLADVFNKRDALMNFYKSTMFPFLCGWSVLVSLGYTDNQILVSQGYTDQILVSRGYEKPQIRTLIGNLKCYALIVNVDTDVQIDLEFTLTQCGFSVDFCPGWTKQGIVAAVRLFRDKMKRVEFLESVLILVGSRRDNEILCSDGGYFELTNDILEQFSGENCPELEEVMKVFLFDFYSVDKGDEAVAKSAGEVHSMTFENNPEPYTSKLRLWKNMIVAYAYYDVHLNFRIPGRRTFFREFCTVVRSQTKEMCINDILEKVSEEVMKKTTKHGEKRMHIWKNFGFTRSLFLHYR